MRRVRKRVIAVEWESRTGEGRGEGWREQGLEERQERRNSLGEHGHMFGELNVGSLTLSPNSTSLAFLSRNDHLDKMRSKVTPSPPNAPT